VNHFPLKFERLSLVFQGSIDGEPYGCEISKVLVPHPASPAPEHTKTTTRVVFSAGRQTALAQRTQRTRRWRYLG
jgi:hypothetical protein